MLGWLDGNEQKAHKARSKCLVMGGQKCSWGVIQNILEEHAMMKGEAMMGETGNDNISFF